MGMLYLHNDIFLTGMPIIGYDPLNLVKFIRPKMKSWVRHW